MWAADFELTKVVPTPSSSSVIPADAGACSVMLRTWCTQPAFQGEYPGWSFEPGCFQALPSDFNERGRGRIQSGRWIMEVLK
jgi:hypothetical protein